MVSSFIRNFLEPLSYFIYSITFLSLYKTNKSTREKVLFVYYLLATLIISYACVLALDYSKNNNWLYNIHYFLSALVFGYYFNSLLIKKTNKIVVKLLFAAVMIIFFFTDIIFNNTYFNSFSTAFLFLCVVISSLIYFHQLLNNMNEKKILLNFHLWLISGYFIYFLGGFFIVLSYGYFTDKLREEQRSILGDLWSVQNVLLFITSIIALSSHIWIAYRNKLR